MDIAALLSSSLDPVKLTDTVTVNRRGPVNRSLLFGETEKVSLPSSHRSKSALSVSLCPQPADREQRNIASLEWGELKSFPSEIKREKTSRSQPTARCFYIAASSPKVRKEKESWVYCPPSFHHRNYA